jgi:hypothetical protein
MWHLPESIKLLVRYLGLMAVITAGILSTLGSGGGGGGGDGSGTAPSLSNLQYSPQAAFINDGGGFIDIFGTIDFTDPDGDLASFVIIVFDSSHVEVGRLSGPIVGAAGITAGQAAFVMTVDTTVAGDFSFSTYVVDSKGNQSNALNGTFPIYAPVQISSNLQDTGQTRCYNASIETNCPLPGDAFYGQDYQYTASPLSYTNNGDGTVTDNVTNLIWRMDDDGNNYNWYEATGTDDAVNNPGAAVDVCGASTFAGQTDWRLPNRQELDSIVDYGTSNPAVDTIYFPSTVFVNYWTSTDIDAANAWAVNFIAGAVQRIDKTTDNRVRCVRGAVWGGNNFVDNGDNTVTDTVSGLTWQVSSQGTGSNWQQMLAFCEGLDFATFTDWRLPDIRELQTLLGAEASVPINQGVYCSSTTIVDATADVWIMQFSPASNYGEVFKHGAGNSKQTCSSFYFRCVR